MRTSSQVGSNFSERRFDLMLKTLLLCVKVHVFHLPALLESCFRSNSLAYCKCPLTWTSLRLNRLAISVKLISCTYRKVRQSRWTGLSASLSNNPCTGGAVDCC